MNTIVANITGTDSACGVMPKRHGGNDDTSVKFDEVLQGESQKAESQVSDGKKDRDPQEKQTEITGSAAQLLASVLLPEAVQGMPELTAQAMAQNMPELAVQNTVQTMPESAAWDVTQNTAQNQADQPILAAAQNQAVTAAGENVSQTVFLPEETAGAGQAAGTAETAQAETGGASQAGKQADGSHLQAQLADSSGRESFREALSGAENSAVSKDSSVRKEKKTAETDTNAMMAGAAEKEQPEAGTAVHTESHAEKAGNKETIRPEYVEHLKTEITKNLAAGKQEFEIQLTPKNLGTLVIKASYEAGKAVISIICNEAKTMQVMSQQARELASMVEERTGSHTEVVVDRPAEDYLQQQKEQQQGRGQERQPQDQREENRNRKFDQNFDFLQQLRLGLV